MNLRLPMMSTSTTAPKDADPEQAISGVRQPTCASILGVAVEALDLERALSRVMNVLQSNSKGYVCAIGVHGIIEALSDPSVAQAFAEASIVVPDGMPMVWIGWIQGHRGMRHVTGPEMMREVFKREEFEGYTHFLYGGKPGVADELAARFTRAFPGTRIVGTYTPPFRDLTRSEEEDVISTINDCRPDMIWVGISTPRQELLMRRLLPRLNVRLMFGVGAAFDFHTGRIRDCPRWIKLLGFQWLHRLVQDPRRLWRRNLRNAAFVWYIALQLLGLLRFDSPASPSRDGNALHLAPGTGPKSATGEHCPGRWAAGQSHDQEMHG